MTEVELEIEMKRLLLIGGFMNILRGLKRALNAASKTYRGNPAPKIIKKALKEYEDWYWEEKQ